MYYFSYGYSIITFSCSFTNTTERKENLCLVSQKLPTVIMTNKLIIGKH